MASPNEISLGTTLVHADDAKKGSSNRDVAPAISVSTTYKYLEDDIMTFDGQVDLQNPPFHVYSRYTQQVGTRVEEVLSKVNQGNALTYASGLAAAYSACVFLKPKRIAIGGGYFGCHESIKVYSRSRDTPLEIIDLDDEYQEGDICWLETPLNPTGESRDIQYYADKIHKVEGKLLVDSTFGPPPLQYPFKFGADIVFHSATKYFGGHSDLLSGVLVVQSKDDWEKLHHDRTYMGNTAGSLEGWLLLRSLRTLHLRIPRQAETATKLVAWLSDLVSLPEGQSSEEGVPAGLVTKVWHSSLQGKDGKSFDPSKQMEGGFNATFSIQLSTKAAAMKFPHTLEYFVPATSLGSIESLVEYRARIPGSIDDPRLVRISIGVEDFKDLKQDIAKGLITALKDSA